MAAATANQEVLIFKCEDTIAEQDVGPTMVGQLSEDGIPVSKAQPVRFDENGNRIRNFRPWVTRAEAEAEAAQLGLTLYAS